LRALDELGLVDIVPHRGSFASAVTNPDDIGRALETAAVVVGA
jgi:hypothetical protein